MEYYISDILDKIVGSTSVDCETYHDKQSIANLQEVELVADWLIERLHNNARWYGDHRASANDVAIRTYEIIEKLHNSIDDLMVMREEKEKEKCEKLIY